MTKRVGRPSKLTKKVQETIVEGIELGMTYELACKRARVTRETMLHWRNRGAAVRERLEEAEASDETVEFEAEEYKYFLFLLAVEEANAECAATHLINLENHSTTNPQVSMWILERRFGDAFGPPKQRQEVSGPNGGPLVVVNWDDADKD